MSARSAPIGDSSRRTGHSEGLKGLFELSVQSGYCLVVVLFRVPHRSVTFEKIKQQFEGLPQLLLVGL